jgi:hypothetical protein
MWLISAEIANNAPRAGACTVSVLGESRAEITIDTAEENASAAISLAKQARYCLNIFSQDLDARVYDNAEFERCVFNLARRHPSTRIRILTTDSSAAVRRSHCVVRLAQTLTSSVFIHNPSPEHRDEICAFLVADGVGLLYRHRGVNNHYEASVNFMSPQRARKLDSFFNEAWDMSTPDPQVRRLYI